jgi:hypothetical protein
MALQPPTITGFLHGLPSVACLLQNIHHPIQGKQTTDCLLNKSNNFEGDLPMSSLLFQAKSFDEAGHILQHLLVLT